MMMNQLCFDQRRRRSSVQRGALLYKRLFSDHLLLHQLQTRRRLHQRGLLQGAGAPWSRGGEDRQQLIILQLALLVDEVLLIRQQRVQRLLHLLLLVLRYGDGVAVQSITCALRTSNSSRGSTEASTGRLLANRSGNRRMRRSTTRIVRRTSRTAAVAAVTSMLR